MPSNEEKEIYYSLRNIASVLYRLYLELSSLESKKMDSSIEYERVLKLVEFYTSLEDEYYKRLEELSYSDEDIIERMYVNTLISTASAFPPDKQLSDPTYIIFHDIKEDDIIPMRMANKLFEVSMIARKDKDEIGDKLYTEYESQKGTYFLDIIDSMSKDKDCESVRNELIKAKYKVAFINKRRCPREPENDFIASTANEVINAQEVLTYAKKMYGLNELSINALGNRRKLLLSIAYIRANLLQMDEVGLQALTTLINVGEMCGDLNPRDGKKLFEGILEYAKNDKETFKSKGKSLKRKF